MANLEHADAAPRLQDIRIVNTDMGNLGEGGMWLPGDLFRRTEVLESRKMGTQPGVRLHLESCAFPWDSGWYSHLAHFRLENIHPAQRPTMETFLAILVGSPNLETLAVIRSCPATPGFTAQLPRLTSLTIDDSSSLCEHLLGFLVVPPTAIIDIACTIPTDIPKDTPLTEIVYQALIPAFSEYTSPDMYDTVCINYKNGFACSLHHSARPEWSRKVKIDAAGWARKGWRSALRATEVVCDHLDFSNVTTLHLHYMPKLPLPRTPDFFRFHSTLSLWDTMGRKLTGVHTLHLHKSYIGSWLEFMLTQAMLLVGVSHHNSCFNIPTSPHGLAFRGPDGALTHAWAGLRCLALHNIDLDVRRHRTGPRRGEMLRALLWARRVGGAPIFQLDIKDCPDCWCPDCVPFRVFADVLDGGGEQKQEDTKESEFLRSYSIDIFAQVVQDDRPLVRDGVRIESPDWVAGSSFRG
ncbi:hypothetical protein B0H14DRAFT_1584079 [Mycena olivaceomarginata]|nr:hypothetical protein B0H14DRAFT_1584079 [Mycena olivaceomarginata]